MVEVRLREKKTGVKGKRAKWTLGLVIFVTVFPSVFALYLHFSQTQPTYKCADLPRAVIIDGIALTKPNPQFIQSVNETLRKAGLDVDVYQGKEVTINLLRNIGGYSLVILRMHSAIDKFGFLYVFSAEKYNETGYSNLRAYGAVKEAITFENQSYFALRADLLGYMSEKGVNGSTIILMGCNGTNSQYAINKLFKKGVKAIIAWNGYVDLGYSDNITLNLLKDIYEDNMSFQKAVEKIMNEYGSDPKWKSRIKYLTQTNQ